MATGFLLTSMTLIVADVDAVFDPSDAWIVSEYVSLLL